LPRLKSRVQIPFPAPAILFFLSPQQAIGEWNLKAFT